MTINKCYPPAAKEASGLWSGDFIALGDGGFTRTRSGEFNSPMAA
jgi:hypothetical protein